MPDEVAPPWGKWGDDAPDQQYEEFETLWLSVDEWVSKPTYDGNVTDTYLFTPRGDRELGDGLDLPEIRVTLGSGTMLMFMEGEGTQRNPLKIKTAPVFIDSQDALRNGSEIRPLAATPTAAIISIHGIISVYVTFPARCTGRPKRLSFEAFLFGRAVVVTMRRRTPCAFWAMK